MDVIDLHCDTISRLFAARSGKPDPFRNEDTASSAASYVSLRQNSFHIDLEKLRKGGYLLQNFALFVDVKDTDNPLETALRMSDLYYEELERNKDLILPVFSYSDILENRRMGRLSAMLTLEEGAVIKGDLSYLRTFYRLGVRMITLTWNYENQIGSPNLTFSEDGHPRFSLRNSSGLTEFGMEAIQEMQRLGIIIDVSHLSDGGFYDVAKHTSVPFVASHSNAAAQCGVCRNLTDPMIRILGERGGVMGLNYCSAFLADGASSPVPGQGLRSGCTASGAVPPPQPSVSHISHMVRHIRHITNVGGIEVCALGSDFDGISNDPEFKDASGLPMLADALSASGFTGSQVEKIFSKNALRVYKDILQ